jgi:hypothetical protein
MPESEAVTVLRRNRERGYTVPSRTLYPHQWSWDLAFNALGWLHVDPDLARTEIETGLGAQWADGRLPHIAFNAEVDQDLYFPGSHFWQAQERARDGRATTGLVQPPIHGGIAARIAVGDPGPGTTAWLGRIYPLLCAWHDYLLTCRVAPGRRLAHLVHPWESGMDNSPMWDLPLSAVDVSGVPAYRRRDLAHADPADRPTDLDYDRYITLAAEYRDRGYDDTRPGSQFTVECPLFNAVLAWSEHGLGEIAEALGRDPSAHRARSRALAQALAEDLFDPGLDLFTAYDVRGGSLIHVRTVSGLVPLLAPDLPDAIAERLVGSAREHFGLGGDGVQLPSVPVADPAFDPNRYWRGPAWVSLNWLVVQGLAAHHLDGAADELAAVTIEMVDDQGCFEYFNPVDGAGRGSPDFSWTAALRLDLEAGRG